MGLLNNFALGRNLAISMVTEPLFNQLPTNINGAGATPFWVNTQSAKLLSYKMEPQYQRKNRMDSRATRSIIEQIEGVIDVNFDMEAFFLPQGGTTPPDLEAAFLSAMGVGATDAGDWLHSLSPSQALPPSFAMLASTNSLPTYSEAMIGAVVEEMTISGQQGEEPKVKFSGMATRHLITGNATVNGTVDGTGTPVGQVTLTAGQTRAFMVGSVVSIGNAAGGRYITAINHATHQITFAPTITTNEGANPPVRPYSPYADVQTGGSPIPGILGDIDISADLDLSIQAFEIKVKNNWKGIRPMFNQYMRDWVPGNREVSGSITFWAQSPDIIRIGRSAYLNASGVNPLPVIITLGGDGVGGAGPGRLVISMPLTSFTPTGVEVPEAEEATFTLNFQAMGSANGDDELTLRWD